jgi:hypothetical protein
VVEFLFGCWHHNLSRPFNLSDWTYEVCLNCGKKFDYDRADLGCNLSYRSSQDAFHQRLNCSVKQHFPRSPCATAFRTFSRIFGFPTITNLLINIRDIDQVSIYLRFFRTIMSAELIAILVSQEEKLTLASKSFR